MRNRKARKYGQGSRFLYLMATRHADSWSCPIKVGITQNLRGRLSAVRTHCPYPVTIFQYWDMGSGENARFLEETFHHLQKDKQISGEWFEMDPRDACFMIEFYGRSLFLYCGIATLEEIRETLGPITIPKEPVWLAGAI